MTTYRFLVGFVFLVIFNLIIGDLPLATGVLADSTIILSLLYLGLVVGLISIIVYYYGLRTTHASVATIFELAFPLSLFVLLPLLRIDLPATVQLVGAAFLIISTTLLSYNYAKLSQNSDDLSVSTA